jgi:hypothetical protein
MSQSTSYSPSRAAAALALWAGAAFAALLAALHVLEPEIDPRWRFISEYALGGYGFLMALAFQVLAAGHVALFVALREQAKTWGGRAGLGFLLLAGAGLALAGAFTTDPITSAAPPTSSGRLHALGGTLCMGMPLAAVLLSTDLARHPTWASARRSLVFTAGLAFLGFLVSAASLAILLSRSAGRFGPDVPVGWPTRFEILTYDLWFVAMAWRAMGAAGRTDAEAVGLRTPWHA